MKGVSWDQPYWCLCDDLLLWTDVPNSKDLLRRCPRCGQIWAWDDEELYPAPVEVVSPSGEPVDWRDIPAKEENRD